MAIRLAAELDVTPWEALLSEVRRSAARVTYLDALVMDATERFDQVRELAIATDMPDENVPRYGLPESIYNLLMESRKERRHYAIVAKAAIDAGVAAQILRSLDAEVRIVFAALEAGLEHLNLQPTQRTEVLNRARLQLTSRVESATGGPITA
jgi:hypothetical protein